MAQHNDERALAIKQLMALVDIPGSLKIILNIPDPKGVQYPVTDPRHWLKHDVERIEPYKDGQYIAYSARYNAKDYGRDDRMTQDECTGQPEALLTRLQEWRG